MFLIAHMFSTTELYQLLKLPVLVEHFFEHKARNIEMSVWDFLALHYERNHMKNNPHNDDYEQDQKLPFMVRTDVPVYCFVHTPPFQFEIKNKPYQCSKQKMLAFDENDMDNDFLSFIWQPPKSCSLFWIR